MSFFTAVKTFFTIAPKAVDDVLDKDNGLLVKAGGWINDLQYTDAEKSKDFATMTKGVIEFVTTTLAESTVRSKTRRNIAILWIKAQLGLILMVAMAISADEIFKTNMKADFFNLATCNVMVWGTGSIIIFFFGAYAWGAHISKKNEPPK